MRGAARGMRGAPAEAEVPVPGPDIERVFREEYGRAVSVLVRVFGDIDIAEDAVQDAFARAVARWPVDGLPPSPAGWIITTARNRAIDRLRREASGLTGTPRPRCCTPARNRAPARARRVPCVTTGSGCCSPAVIPRSARPPRSR